MLTDSERVAIARQLEELRAELAELVSAMRERISRVEAAIGAPASRRRPSPGR
jgi:hypothetical protein